MAGVDILTVCELLGHSDIKMTMRYAHLSPDYKAKAVQRLDTIWTPRQVAKESEESLVSVTDEISIGS